MPVIKINAADTDCGADAHQVRAGNQAAFSHRPEIVDLELHCGETARAAEMVMDRAADGGVCDTGCDSAVQRASRIQQLGPQAALDGEAVTMHADNLQAEQVIESVPGEERSHQVGWFWRLVQVGDFNIVERERI